MGNLYDYLDWRGDLTLAQAPFNQVDSLILSALSYLELEDVFSWAGAGAQIPLAQVAEVVEEGKTEGEKRRFQENHLRLLSALKGTARFRDMALLDYQAQSDPVEEKQFAAVTILTGDGAAYLSFRGTDSTLTGWKEDFNMAYMDSVPAQRSAVRYLEERAARLRCPLRVGGHSKGGNLAVYAAVFSAVEAQARLLDIYNHDGPGFSAGVLRSLRYLHIRERVHTFVPQSSVVGMLLDHEERYTVVRSSNTGLLQHDLYSWQVQGAGFLSLEEISEGSRLLDQALREWVFSMGKEQRARFVDALFEVLTAIGTGGAAGAAPTWPKSAGAVLHSLRDLDEPTRGLLSGVVGALWKAGLRYAAGPASDR